MTSRGSLGGLKRFVITHDRLLTFLGALVVLITFVLKEGVRDHVKDRVDDVRAAINAYEIRSDLQLDSEEITAEEAELLKFYDRTKSMTAAQLLGYNGAVAEHCQRIQALLSKTVRAQNDVSDLANALPPNDELNRSEKEDADQLKRFRQEVVSTDADAAGPEISNLGPEFIQYTNDQVKLLAINTRTKANKLGEDVPLRAQLVWVHGKQTALYAREIVENEEKQYRHATWASYVLYTIGWGLGLFARLFGVSSTSGEEDSAISS